MKSSVATTNELWSAREQLARKWRQSHGETGFDNGKKRRIFLRKCDPPLIELATVNPIMSLENPYLGGMCILLGILGIAGGLVAECFLIKGGLMLEEEMQVSNADDIYGLLAFCS